MASLKTPSFSIFFTIFSLLTLLPNSLSSPLPTLPSDLFYSPDHYATPPPPLGYWTLLHHSIGISAMHMQLLNTDTIVIFDRTDFGPSNLSLPSTTPCPTTTTTTTSSTATAFDCTAHSVLYDVASNTFRPLTILTDTWCSSGSVDPTGKLIQTGGYSLGERVIRTFTPCYPSSQAQCDWEELKDTSLAARRWYASNHILPDGRVIIVGGRGSHSYEFYPKKPQPSQPGKNRDKFYLRFLAETWEGRNRENNLYPFLHLLPNGNLFIFAGNRSIEFDYGSGRVVREFPQMPSQDRRNYPSTGSSVILPLFLNSSANDWSNFEVLVCGGAPPGSFDLADVGNVFVEASRTCGRMEVFAAEPRWIMEEMPMPRVMPDMVMLPTGDVLLVNGASNGTAGWENAENPVLNPVLYRTYETDPTRKFVVLNPGEKPRMYHSTAVLVPDGRVIVGGSNPHRTYNFSSVKYPTELSLEAFSPPYLERQFAALRPAILAVEAVEGKVVVYGETVAVTYALAAEVGGGGAEAVAVTMVLPPFATHSFGMNQRVVVMEVVRVEQLSRFGHKVTVKAPVNVNVAPPGYYMLFVVHVGVPSHGVWVQLKRSFP